MRKEKLQHSGYNEYIDDKVLKKMGFSISSCTQLYHKPYMLDMEKARMQAYIKRDEEGEKRGMSDKGKHNLPFTKEEIANSYLHAEDRRKQPAILAQLNGCSKQEINMILEEMGITLMKQKEETRGRKPKKEEREEELPIEVEEAIEKRLMQLEEEIKYYRQVIENSVLAITEREITYRQLASHIKKGIIS